jgi:rRNA maturation endonuclease Nob1
MGGEVSKSGVEKTGGKKKLSGTIIPRISVNHELSHQGHGTCIISSDYLACLS